jgi:two-component system phosphate regulon sensor histidine kinase PhoR
MEFFITLSLGFFLGWFIMFQKFKKIGDKFQNDINQLTAKLEKGTDAIISEVARLETVLSSMVEGVMVTDGKGGIVLMNPAMRKLFLVDSPPEGKISLEVVRNTEVQNIVSTLLKGEQKLRTEEILVYLPEEKVLKVNGATVMKDGKVEGSVLVFHDITELRRLENIRRDFVANVSHELRTPISSIKGYSETLLEGAIEDKDNAKDFISIIYKESNRLAKLIDDLLNLSRIESNGMKMVFLPVDVLSVINRIVSIIDKQAELKSISIRIDALPGLQKVLADETRLSQVILNLLDNAVKYTHENGVLTITVLSKDAKFIQVDVSDTGIGIPEKDLPRIFERFYRVDKARSRELGGTGLGLSIVKHIIQAHGGEVWVKSEPGKGSTFSFTIPKA